MDMFLLKLNNYVIILISIQIWEKQTIISLNKISFYSNRGVKVSSPKDLFYFN